MKTPPSCAPQKKSGGWNAQNRGDELGGVKERLRPTESFSEKDRRKTGKRVNSGSQEERVCDGGDHRPGSVEGGG